MNVYSFCSADLATLKEGDVIISRHINPLFDSPATGQVISVVDGYVIYTVRNFAALLRVSLKKLEGSYVVISGQKHLLK